MARALMLELRVFCIDGHGLFGDDDGKTMQCFYDSLHKIMVQSIRGGIGDRASEAKRVGRVLKMEGSLPNLAVSSDDLCHEVLISIKKAFAPEPVYALVNEHIFQKEGAPGKMLSHSSKQVARMVVAQEGAISELKGSETSLLQRSIRDMCCAQHRFHSIAGP